MPGVTTVESPYTIVGARQISKDGTVAYATVDFAKTGNEIPAQTTDAVENRAVAARGNGLQVELGGQIFTSKPKLGAAELIGIIAAIIILLVVFGSVLAMGLPIMIALFGIGIGLAFVEMISHVLSTPSFAAELASMIGIGVGIDYALFIVTRYRQGLHEGLDPEAAVIRAIDTVGPSSRLRRHHRDDLGPGPVPDGGRRSCRASQSVRHSPSRSVMVASITLLPALLGFAGRNIDKLSVPGRRTRESRLPSRASGSGGAGWCNADPGPRFLGHPRHPGGTGRPAASASAMGFSDAGGNPTSDTTRRRPTTSLTRGFGPGFNGPLILAAEFPKGTSRHHLNRLVVALRHTPGVAAASPPDAEPGPRPRR